MSKQPTERAEVFWYHAGYELAANALESDDTSGPTKPGDVIVNLPAGLAGRLNAAADTLAGLVDEILTHLRDTGQAAPSRPEE